MEELQTSNPELFSAFRRHFHSLHESNVVVRKNSLKELLHIIESANLSPQQFQEVTHMGLKDILKCFCDSSQFCRQTSISLMLQLLPRCTKISSFLPYIYSTLIDRTNCVDLQGIANVPQKMRPAAGQKPKVLCKLIEVCEEVRMQYCKLMDRVCSLCEENDIRKHIEDIVNILRALVMDPAPDVQTAACGSLKAFCNGYSHLLLHYTEVMGRAVLLPLVGKKSRVRMAGLNALTAVLWCGLWKYNAFIFENLIGFRDPNSVPIKDFYEPSHNINYFATFINDGNSKIRQEFMRHVKVWVCDLDDRYDHHGRLVPYLLSGLFDSDHEVRELALATITLIGQQMEIEKEKDFRENKQFAIDAAWTWDGRLTHLPIEQPLKGRPSLGSRFFVRGHVRKFWTALYKEIKDINEQNRMRAASLTLFGVIFTENYLTQYLDVMIPQILSSLYPLVEDKKVSEVLFKVMRYIGRYCEASAYTHILKSALQGDFVANQNFVKAAMKGLTCIVEGSLEAVPEKTGLCHKLSQIKSVLALLHICVADIYHQNSVVGKEMVHVIMSGLKQKANQEELSEIMNEYGIVLFRLFSVSYYEQYYGTCCFGIKKADHSCNLKELLQQFDVLNGCSVEFGEHIEGWLHNVYLNAPSVMDYDWKCIIVLYNYFTAKEKQQFTLLQLTQQVITESVVTNKTIQMLYFVCKYPQYLYHQLSTNEHLHFYVKILITAFTAISQFTVIKKVPIYDQHLMKQYAQGTNKMNEDAFIDLFKCLSQSIQVLFIKVIPLDPMQLGRLIHEYLRVMRQYSRSRVIRLEAIRTLWMVSQRVMFSREMEYEGEQTVVYPIAEVVDFAVDQIETMGEPDAVKSNMLFSTLQNIINQWPELSDPKKNPETEHIYADYGVLLNKMIAYAMDEKDLQVRAKFRELLRCLCRKLKRWFELELVHSEESKRYAKARIIKEILDDS